jgi:MFS transporter, OFA family, oxalate/formate antiporter
VTLALSLFALMNGVARPLFGRFMDKRGLSWSVRTSLFLMGTAALVGIVNQGNLMLLFILSFSLFWFNLGAWLSMMPAAVKTIYGMDAYARIYGKLFTAYGVGAVSGTFLSGAILDVFGDTTYVYMLVLVAVVFAFLVTGKGLRPGLDHDMTQKGEQS